MGIDANLKLLNNLLMKSTKAVDKKNGQDPPI
jgi:hypothetical protein